LNRGYNLTSFGTNHCEAKNAVVARGDKRLHEALCFVDGVRPQHCARRQFCGTRFDTLTSSLAFAQSHSCQRRICKHTERKLAVARRAVCPSQIVPNDTEVVERHMGELRAASALPDRPDVGRTGL